MPCIYTDVWGFRRGWDSFALSNYPLYIVKQKSDFITFPYLPHIVHTCKIYSRLNITWSTTGVRLSKAYLHTYCHLNIFRLNWCCLLQIITPIRYLLKLYGICTHLIFQYRMFCKSSVWIFPNCWSNLFLCFFFQIKFNHQAKLNTFTWFYLILNMKFTFILFPPTVNSM